MSLEDHKLNTLKLVDTEYPCIFPEPDKEPFGFVYGIRNVLTNQLYIGSTVDFNRRVAEYIRAYQLPSTRYDRTIHRELRAQGISCFKMYKIEACYSAKELRAKELEYIKTLNTKVPNGYNDSFVVSFSNRKQPNRKKGILASAESRKKRSRPVFAVDLAKRTLYISDSIRLLAENVFYCDRAILSHAAKLGQKAYNNYLIYADVISSYDLRNAKIEQYERNRGKRSGCIEGRVEEYTLLIDYIVHEGFQFFINNDFVIYILEYSDNTPERYELYEFDYADITNDPVEDN